MRRVRSEPGWKTVASRGAMSGVVRRVGDRKTRRTAGGTPRFVVHARLRLVDFGVGAELWVLV